MLSSLTTEKQKKAAVNQKKESGQLDENLEIKQEENIEEEPKQEEDIKEEPCESEEGITQRNRKARLIVRNLSFKVFVLPSFVLLIITVSLSIRLVL